MSLCPGTNTSVAENADVYIPETPPPLMSANVCNWVPPPPLKIADVLCGRPLSTILSARTTLKSLIEEQTGINEQGWKKIPPCLLFY